MNLRQNWARLFSRSSVRRRRPTRLVSAGIGAEVLESRALLAAAVPNFTLTNISGALTLTSTDNYDTGLTITRSTTNVNNVLISAVAGSQITFGTSILSTQTISLATVKSLTVNLGAGINTVNVVGLSMTGDLTINGTATGKAFVTVNAGTLATTIGGSINANLGSEVSTFNLFGSANFGGSLTVTGSVNVIENGAGAHQVNLAGPLANNPSGGKLFIGGSVNVLDTGFGTSGFHIDDGVKITGNVSFDNSVNNVSANKVEIFSNSLAYGVTTIGGTLNIKTSSANYAGNTVQLVGFGTPLVVTGVATIVTGAGADKLTLQNTSFTSALSLNAGTSPSYSRDIMKIDGSTFATGVTVSASGASAELDLGTDKTFGPTTFKGTFAAYLTGAFSQIYISNASSTSSEVNFNSNVTFVGGASPGTYYVQGLWTITNSKFVKTNFTTTAPTAVKATVKAVLVGNNLTLTSTDARNPVFTVTRSTSKVVITAGLNTQITYLTTTAASQSILLNSLANLTITLGTGISDVTVSGLSMTGDLTINGATNGLSTVTINATPGNTTIGGSIIENFGASAGTLNVYGSTNNGGALTVTGSVAVTASGAGMKQVNIAGPLGGNPAGGKTAIKKDVTMTDTGNGVSGLHIDDGVTITGNVAYDNSLNTVNPNKFEVFSNSTIYGVSSIGGTLNVKTSRAVYAGDVVTLQGFGTPLVVTGAVTLSTGNGPDSLAIANATFSSTTTTSIDLGTSPAFVRDQIAIDGGTFTGPFVMTAGGAAARMTIGTDPTYLPTNFKSTFKAYMTGSSATVLMSNKTSTVNQVLFASTVLFSGGTPNGTLTVNGLWSINLAKLTRTNFDLVFA